MFSSNGRRCLQKLVRKVVLPICSSISRSHVLMQDAMTNKLGSICLSPKKSNAEFKRTSSGSFPDIVQNRSSEFDRRFPQHKLLDAFGIIYPQSWRQEGADQAFVGHLAVIKSFYCHAATINDPQSQGLTYTAREMLSASSLENRQGLFKTTMKANCEDACGPPFRQNPVVKLWRKLSQSRHLNSLIFEYFKLAEIGCCMVLGLVEDERCFSTLKFLKSCQRNRLGKHLPLVVRMFGQKYYTLKNFPYKDTIESWRNAVKIGRHGDI